MAADGGFGVKLAHQIGGFRFGVFFDSVVFVEGGVYGDLGIFFEGLVDLVDGLLGTRMAS